MHRSVNLRRERKKVGFGCCVYRVMFCARIVCRRLFEPGGRTVLRNEPVLQPHFAVCVAALRFGLSIACRSLAPCAIKVGADTVKLTYIRECFWVETCSGVAFALLASISVQLQLVVALIFSFPSCSSSCKRI